MYVSVGLVLEWRKKNGENTGGETGRRAHHILAHFLSGRCCDMLVIVGGELMCGTTLGGQKEGSLRRVRVQQSEHPHCKQVCGAHKPTKATRFRATNWIVLASRGHYRAAFQSTSCPLVSLRESLNT